MATHSLFTSGALAGLSERELEEIAVTDTVAVDSIERYAKLRVLSVSGLLAQTIRSVSIGSSVSAIFAGENELF